MRSSKTTLYTFMLFAMAFIFATPSKACDNSSMTLLGVTALSGGQYALNLRFCAGAGKTGVSYGADNDTWLFAFFISNDAQFVSQPAQIVSPQTGYVYLDTVTGGDTLIYYNSNYFAGAYEPWACIFNCGTIQTVCYDITIVTQGLPSTLRLGGIEAAGNIGGGCSGADMTVYPQSFGCNILPNAAVSQPICAGSTGSISLSPSGGNAPYSFTWSNGTANSSISGLAPGSYSVTIQDVSRSCIKTATYIIDAPAAYSIELGLTKKVYRGYASLSCTTLNPVNTGGVGPFTYLWSTGSTASTINVCPIVNTTYNVTVTDSRGCTATDNVLVNVVDVRCGSSMNKVILCHSGTTLCVTQSQAATHIGHGDALGNCVTKDAEAGAASDDVVMEYTLSAYPVPARETVHFDVQSPQQGTLALEVFDLQGKLVASQSGIEAEGSAIKELTVNVTQWKSGIYIAWVNHSASGLQTIKFTVVK